MIPQAARINRRAKARQSSDTCWPLRGVDGLTYAERARAAAEKADREARAAFQRHLQAVADAAASNTPRNLADTAPSDAYPQPRDVEVVTGPTSRR